MHKATGTNKIFIKAGDVVHLHNDTKRINWKLAVVESLITGKDGLVRAANIRTCTGHTNRPITKLYPLEVAATTRSTPDDSLVPSTHDESIANSPLIDDNQRIKDKPQLEKQKKTIKDWTCELLRAPEDVAD